jgi:hypothetical protein
VKKEQNRETQSPRIGDDQGVSDTGILENKMFRLKRPLIRAFDVLKAEQGPHSGPRLIAEAINLLLVKYGKEPIDPQK